jgi:hypothetical protein
LGGFVRLRAVHPPSLNLPRIPILVCGRAGENGKGFEVWVLSYGTSAAEPFIQRECVACETSHEEPTRAAFLLTFGEQQMKLSEQQMKTQLGVTRKQLNEMVRQGEVIKHADGSYSMAK